MSVELPLKVAIVAVAENSFTWTPAGGSPQVVKETIYTGITERGGTVMLRPSRGCNAVLTVAPSKFIEVLIRNLVNEKGVARSDFIVPEKG